MEKTYNIKLEDKAAFLNRLEKAGVNVETSEIKDDILNGTFSITFDNPEDIQKAKIILSQSPKITKLKELLRNIVRDELKK